MDSEKTVAHSPQHMIHVRRFGVEMAELVSEMEQVLIAAVQMELLGLIVWENITIAFLIHASMVEPVHKQD